jgi:hypothetical protein
MVRAPSLAVVAVALAACGSSGDPQGTPARAAGEPCSSASDCQPGLACIERTCAASLPAGECPAAPAIVLAEPVVPASRPDPIADPPCALPVRPVARAFPAGQVQEKGPLPVGAIVRFDVPDRTQSLTIVAQEVNGSAAKAVTTKVGGQAVTLPNTVQPTDLVAPGPIPFYDDLAPHPADPTGLLAQHVGFQPSTGVMTLPNTSRALDLVRSAGLPAGAWQFTLTDTAAECEVLGCTAPRADAVYDVKVLTRPGPLERTGAVDLDVYLVSSDPSRPDLTARDATADPEASDTARHFRRFVSTFSRIFSAAGLCVATVRVHEVPEWARADFHDLAVHGSGPCAAMPRLFSLAAPEPGVHLFLVDTLVTSAAPGKGTVLVGIDGAIPGPSAIPGTLNSGTAVVLANFGFERAAGACSGAVDLGGCGTDQVAYVAAHEAGHWLGLYHTTEASGTFFDPLGDTPACPCSACAPPGQRAQCAAGTVKLFSEACSGRVAGCGGADNLMFWLVDPNHSAGALSLEQGEVMRSNPAVR